MEGMLPGIGSRGNKTMKQSEFIQWEFFKEPFVVYNIDTLPGFRNTLPGKKLMWEQDAICFHLPG